MEETTPPLWPYLQLEAVRDTPKNLSKTSFGVHRSNIISGKRPARPPLTNFLFWWWFSWWFSTQSINSNSYQICLGQLHSAIFSRSINILFKKYNDSTLMRRACF